MHFTIIATLLAAVLPVTQEEERRGLIKNEEGAYQGYTIIAPLDSHTIYLVDMKGEVVHQWETGFGPGSEYLLENGNLMRCCREKDPKRFKGGGIAGRLQEISWDGEVIWDWTFTTDKYCQHHDIEITPDGTILMIAWEAKTRDEAIENGRYPGEVGETGLWPDYVIEVSPVYPDGADIIWEWHVWDHLIQDYDSTLENFGVIEEHPELIDINGGLDRPKMSAEELAALIAIGYVDDTPNVNERASDWLHTNAINFNAELDQIALSIPKMSEIWIIDHSTMTEEAATHEGGQSGMGGDLLYRWGNPANYGRGSKDDLRLFFQHDVRWIPDGYPGYGNLMIFNNGGGRPNGSYSSVIELVLPLSSSGTTYKCEENQAFGPSNPTWLYKKAPEFFSSFISGAHRLPNGNTLICQGQNGRVFEVTGEGEVVWEFLNPFSAEEDSTGDAPPNALFRATRIGLNHPALQGTGLESTK